MPKPQGFIQLTSGGGTVVDVRAGPPALKPEE